MQQTLGVLFLVILSFSATAQTDRYWAHNFNAKASLLSGAVVGGGAGNSSVYYNPALISTEDGALALNASVLRYSRLSVDQLVKSTGGFSDNDIGLGSRFISFTLKLNKEKPKPLFLQIGTFSKDEQELRAYKALRKQVELIDQLPGEEFFSGTLEYRLDYADRWFGGGVSQELKNGFRAGVSLFVSVSKLIYDYRFGLNVIPSQGGLGSLGPTFVTSSTLGTINKARYSQAGLLWKLGLAYEKNQWELGLNITTPLLRVYSSGASEREIARVNLVDRDSLLLLDNIYFYDFQENLDAEAKKPWGFAFGANYVFKNGKAVLHSTVEYFTKIKAYRIITGDAGPESIFVGEIPGVGKEDFLSYTSGAESILNFALGLELFRSENRHLLIGLRTDYNYLKELDYGELSMVNRINEGSFNVYHLSLGYQFLFQKKHALLVGVEFSKGKTTNFGFFDSFVDSFGIDPNVEERQLFQELELDGVESRFTEISLFLGYSFDF